MLQSEGYTTRIYNDGATALDGVDRKARPTSRSSTSRCRAWTAWNCLRRLRERSQLPVIFLTTKDDENDELSGLKMGADDYIRKPFPKRLLVAGKAVLRRTLPRDAAAGVIETSRRCSSAAS